jgi:type II secretory pathway pseudopilin PulG
MLQHLDAMKRFRAESGFTLIEMLVAVTLSMIIFGVTLTVLDIYNRDTTTSTQRNDAQDQARLGIDRIVWQLRNIASPVTSPKLLERATPYDLVFQTIGTVNGANTTGAERVRYCIPNDTPTGNPQNEVLIGETQTWNSAAPPASPWNSSAGVTIPCPDSPLPGGVSSQVIVQMNVTNRYQQSAVHPAFCYDNSYPSCTPADPTSVGSVQIDLLVNPTPQNATAETELRSAAFLRNQVHSPVAQFTPYQTGNGGVMLDGGASYSPDGQALSYKWACVGPTTPCPDNATISNATQGLVNWNPGPGTYTVTLTVTDPTGLTAQQTLPVPVT